MRIYGQEPLFMISMRGDAAGNYETILVKTAVYGVVESMDFIPIVEFHPVKSGTSWGKGR